MAADLHAMILEYLDLCGLAEQFLQQIHEVLNLCEDLANTPKSSRLLELYEHGKAEATAVHVDVAQLNGDVCHLQSTPQTTVSELKSRIESCTSIPVKSQRLLWSHQILDDKQTLAACQISPPSLELSLVRKVPCPHIYVLGGYAVNAHLFGGEGIQSSGEIFDPSTGIWTSLPNMAKERGRFASCAMDDESIIAIGGWGTESHLLDAERLDLSTGMWRELLSMEKPRVSFAAAINDGLLYLVGGGFPRHKGTTGDVDVFDLRTHAWTAASPMFEARSRFGIAMLDSRLYVMGGWHAEGRKRAMRSAEVFDCRSKTWTLLPSMVVGRRAPAAAALDGNIYAIGGSAESDDPLESVEVFNVSTSAWERVPPMSIPRTAAAAVALDGNIYVLGGINNQMLALTSAEVFAPSKGLWAPLPPMTVAHACHSAGLIRLLQ